MIFIFGRYKKLKLCQDQSPLKHKRCSNPNCMGRRVALMEKSSTCHFMFIPLIPMGSTAMVKCVDCGLLSELEIHEMVWERRVKMAAASKKKLGAESPTGDAASTPLAVTEAVLVEDPLRRGDDEKSVAAASAVIVDDHDNRPLKPMEIV